MDIIIITTTAIFGGNNVEAVRLGETVKPVRGKVRAAGCVLDAALAGAGAEESASSPRGDGAFQVEADGAAVFFKMVKLEMSATWISEL